MCNEGRVLFGFLFGRAFMPHEIVGANVSDQVKEEPLHDRTTEMGLFRSREMRHRSLVSAFLLQAGTSAETSR